MFSYHCSFSATTSTTSTTFTTSGSFSANHSTSLSSYFVSFSPTYFSIIVFWLTDSMCSPIIKWRQRNRKWVSCPIPCVTLFPGSHRALTTGTLLGHTTNPYKVSLVIRRHCSQNRFVDARTWPEIRDLYCHK